MSDRIRPLVLGYIREEVLRGERLASAQTRLEQFAHTEGFTLGTVFVERRQTAPWAFDALLEEIHRRDEAWAVVVPDIGHFDEAHHRAMSARQLDYASMTVLVAP